LPAFCEEDRPGMVASRLSSSDGAESVRLPEDLRDFAEPQLKVGILLWPDFTLLALSGFIDALRLACDVGDRSRQRLCRWDVMAAQPQPIRASCGLPVIPTSPLADPGAYHYIVVVSGLLERIDEAPSGALDYLRRAAALDIPLVGLCTGAFVLAAAGLLEGRRACVANYHYREFRERFPAIPQVHDQLFIADRGRITCAGGAASIDLAAHLVRLHCGADRAVKLAHTMMVDQLRRPTSAQRVLYPDHETIGDPRVTRAIALMEQHLSARITVAEIARLAKTSERQLERAFREALAVSPSDFFKTLRLKRGHWLITHTAEPISQIAYECGFADHSHFTRQFRQAYAVTPLQARLAQRQEAPAA